MKIEKDFAKLGIHSILIEQAEDHISERRFSLYPDSIWRGAGAFSDNAKVFCAKQEVPDRRGIA